MLTSNRTGADTATPADIEILLERLLSGAPASTSTPPPQTGITGMETLVYFLGGKPGHGVGRHPELDETFLYMLLGWSAEKVGANYVMISPHVAAERRQVGNGD